MHLTRLPLEIFDAIVLHLTALEPIGPPSVLVPLMQACRALHALLVPHANPGLYARIFRQKFDVAAVTRRAFRPTPAQCVDQMAQYFAALRVFRRRDLHLAPAPGEELLDVDLDAALQIAVVMMLEDDGKNARQLVHWGHADEFVDAFVRSRLYEDAETNDGWPIEDSRNAHALWLMWLLTTEESLLKESPARRAQMMQLLLPFVYVPYRYPAALAPPNHYHVPPIAAATVSVASTIPTPHGPYPLYPSPSFYSASHFSSRPQLARPLAAIAAKLLFFARTEVTPLPIPPHLDRTRADSHARGNFEIGPTREDIEEYNWGWTARLPGGRKWERVRSPLDDDDDEEEFPKRPEGMVFPGFEVPVPVPKWVGKAPHAGEYLLAGEGRGRGREKSRKWDADWFRMRMCGDLTKIPPRVPYGRTFEPLSLVGLWHGRMLLPAEQEIQNLMNNPLHPPHGLFTEDTLAVIARPFYVRIHELHGVAGEVVRPSPTSSVHHQQDAWPPAPPFGLSTHAPHDWMTNAWFAGAPRVVPLSSSPHAPSEAGEKVELVVCRERGTYRCHHGRGAERRGNDAYGGPEPDEVEVKGEWEWAGYEHDGDACAACCDRAEFRRRLGAGEGPVGAVSPSPSPSAAQSPSPSAEEGGSEAGSDQEEYDEEGEEGEEEGGEGASEDVDVLMEPWDGDDAFAAAAEGEGRGALPMTHEWARRGRGPCDGLADVVVVGQPDPAHAAAWHPYRYHGRIRPWDGLLLLVRTSAREEDPGTTLFYGYVVGRDTVVGNWRFASADPGAPVWEGTWCMSRRED